MKIICGTDFSEHAREAGTLAAALAAKLKATLSLAHVFDTSHYEVPSKEIMHYLRESRETRLKREAERLRRSGANVTEQLLRGSPALSLARAAEHSGADLIVVSSLGQAAPKGPFVGSVAERTAQNAAVPTLVVREAKSLAAWARGKHTLNVFIGYDFGDSGDAALRWSTFLTQIGPCKINVVYVAWPPDAAMRWGIGDDQLALYYPAKLEKLLQRDLREKCQQILGNAKLRLQVAASLGRPDAQLMRIASSEKADLILVGTNQRRGLARLGSISRSVLHHASMSVACVPIAAKAPKPNGIPVFSRVLVVTDFSNDRRRPLPFAYSLLPDGGEVWIMQVVWPARPALKGSRHDPLAAELRTLIPFEVEPRGIKTHIEVVEHSDAAAAVCETAERVNADVICLTSHRRSGPTGTASDSLSRSIISSARRPILLIPYQAAQKQKSNYETKERTHGPV